jgi:hypothetical protein
VPGALALFGVIRYLIALLGQEEFSGYGKLKITEKYRMLGAKI